MPLRTFILAVFATLAACLIADAQAVKWESAIPHIDREYLSCEYTLHADGNGGCFLLLSYKLPTTEITQRMVWVNLNGKVFFQDTFITSLTHRARVHRVANGTATLILYRTVEGEALAYQTRSHKLTPRGISTRIEREIEPNERFVDVPPTPDKGGYFVALEGEKGEPVTIRRVKNLK